VVYELVGKRREATDCCFHTQKHTLAWPTETKERQWESGEGEKGVCVSGKNM
jgi:hypothetical protein